MKTVCALLCFIIIVTSDASVYGKPKKGSKRIANQQKSWSIPGATLITPADFVEFAKVGNENRFVSILLRTPVEGPVTQKSLDQNTGLARLKSFKKTKKYALANELEKLTEEWKEFHDVILRQDLKQAYAAHPLEKQKGTFDRGVGNIIFASIIGNPNQFKLMTYVGESKDRVIILSMLSPSEKQVNIYKANLKAFELLTGSVP